MKKMAIPKDDMPEIWHKVLSRAFVVRAQTRTRQSMRMMTVSRTRPNHWNRTIILGWSEVEQKYVDLVVSDAAR